MAEPLSEFAFKDQFEFVVQPGVLLQIAVRVMNDIEEKEGDDECTWSDMGIYKTGLKFRIGNSSIGTIAFFTLCKSKLQSLPCETPFRTGIRLRPLNDFLENRTIGGCEITVFKCEGYPVQLFYFDEVRANFYELETLDLGENAINKSPDISDPLCRVKIDCETLRDAFEEMLNDDSFDKPVTVEVTKDELSLVLGSINDSEAKAYFSFEEGMECEIKLKESVEKCSATVSGINRWFPWIASFMSYHGEIQLHRSDKSSGNFMSISFPIRPKFCDGATAALDTSKVVGAFVFFYYPTDQEPEEIKVADILKSLLVRDQN